MDARERGRRRRRAIRKQGSGAAAGTRRYHRWNVMDARSPESTVFTALELARFVVFDTRSPAEVAHRLLDCAGDRLDRADCAVLADVLQGLDCDQQLCEVLRRIGEPLPTFDEAHTLLLRTLAQQVVDGRVEPRAVGLAMVWHARRRLDDHYYWELESVIGEEPEGVAWRLEKAGAEVMTEEQALQEFWKWAAPRVRAVCASIVGQVVGEV